MIQFPVTTINWSDVNAKFKCFSSLDVSPHKKWSNLKKFLMENFIFCAVWKLHHLWNGKGSITLETQVLVEEYVPALVNLVSVLPRWCLKNVLSIVIKSYFGYNLWNLCLSPTSVSVFFHITFKCYTSINSYFKLMRWCFLNVLCGTLFSAKIGEGLDFLLIFDCS